MYRFVFYRGMDFLKKLRYFTLLVAWTFVSSCASKRDLPADGIQMAFIADVHLQDVYGKLEDSDYRGIKNPKTGEYVLIRTMGSQLRSTRIFNENYFAFLAALDNVVRRGVKYVLIPGDFSDDGQAVHIRGLKAILDEYTRHHGISFYLITGNHDVVQPFIRQGGKTDFLGEDGRQQPIVSYQYRHTPDPGIEHPAVVTKDMQNLGYTEITRFLGDFGFFPKKGDIYWESPFSNYSYEDYQFKKAKELASLEHRSYFFPSNDVPLPDVSYLVEPIPGLWLLAIDANTYLKRDLAANVHGITHDYPNTGIGYDNLLGSKKYLVYWIKKVVKEAEKRGKILISFSHYPMVDFNDGASRQISNLLVGSKMQLKRIPNEKISEILADSGLKLHFGGHMHINDTGIRTTEIGNTLVNIQVPSMAAYRPAYKILSIKQEGMLEVTTVSIDTVPRFNEFFNLYDMEHQYLERSGDQNIWDRNILESKSYHEFMTWHLKELVRLRFLPAEWPPGFANFLSGLSGLELLLISTSDGSDSFADILEIIRADVGKTSPLWTAARKSLETENLSVDHFSDWSGSDLIFALYRLRSADQLAFGDIGAERLKQYRFLAESFLKQGKNGTNNDENQSNMIELMLLFKKFMEGDAADHFQIDLNTMKVTPIKDHTTD